MNNHGNQTLIITELIYAWMNVKHYTTGYHSQLKELKCSREQ